MPRSYGYQSPADRLKSGAGGMGGMGEAPPGQMEPENPGKDAYSDEAMPAKAEPETFEAPIAAAFGGKKFKPGEEVVMKVVNIDEKNGMVTLAYSTGEDEHEGHEEPMGEEEGSAAMKHMDEAMPEEG